VHRAAWIAISQSSLGAQVEAVEDDLAAKDGVDRLCDAIGDRPVSALLGHGLAKRSWIRTFADIEHVIDTNITGTIYLAHRGRSATIAQ
jgi:hypothetical protein